MAEADYATGTKSRPEGTRDPSSFAVRRLRVNLLLLRNTTNVSFKRCAILGSCTTLQVAKKFFFFVIAFERIGVVHIFWRPWLNFYRCCTASF